MQNSIRILEKLLRQDKDRQRKRFKRDTELLADFSSGYAKDWFFCVPIFFYDALDIKFTYRKKEERKIWTQGSTFNFSVGDMIWNYSYPYCKNFVSEIIMPKIGIQVQSSKSCLPQTKNRLRNEGKINFTIVTENYVQDSKDNWKTIGNYSLSQDGFVEFLITGCSKSLEIDLTLRGS
jgi:hypothetical protein